ncbi:MAG: cadherin domain-containing protein [Verrucomicrobiota bacterium]
MKNPNRLLCLAVLLALALGGLVEANFVLVEDFQSHVTGADVDTANGWVSSGDTVAVIAADPVVSSNQALHRVGVGGASKSGGSIHIAQGSTATFFLRVLRDGAGSDEVFGISDASNPNLAGDFTVFEAQSGVLGSNLRVRDGGGLQSRATLAAGSWYNLWMVVNNSTDTWRFYMQSDDDPAFTNQTEITSTDGTINFRNAPDTKALVSFLAKATSGTNSVFYDDIYIDTAGSNLTLPPFPGSEPVAVDDAVETGVGGAIAFNPLANDTGSINPSSLQIISPPSAGTATFDAAAGRLIYKHTGSNPGVDHFTYRITSKNGILTSDGDVKVTISGNLRLANVTLNVPADPPAAAAGGLTIVDALPGLGFSGAVGMTSIPGAPAALLVASIDGSVWYVPDSTATTPRKYKVLDVASLSNFTRGRSIYSIECFPDFATTGHIIVNYQGDSSRLPVPGLGQTVHDVMKNLDKNGAPDPVIECDLRVSRFTLSPAHIADAVANGMSAAENLTALGTELPYINLAEQHLFHSINDCKFGPDGYLYVTFGDEGDQGDPHRNGQRLTKDFYSSMIRIDLNPASTNPKPNPHYAIAVGGLNGLHSPNTPYTDSAQNPNFRVPADNPFIHTSLGGTWNGNFDGSDFSSQLSNVRTEMWAVGLRNPFKFHLDVEDGTGLTEAWIGDVGKDSREEFSILKKGENGGWSYYEGDIVTPGLAFVPPMPSGATPPKAPLFTYPHSNGNNSATGGVFYRDTALPTLTGRYICGDYGSGRIWSISRDGSSVIELTDLRLSTNRIVDFHVDPVTREILVLENGGSSRVMRITVQAAGPENYPPKLSDLGIFADLADLSPNAGVLPYTPNLTFWSDGAEKKRWFVIKNTSDMIGYSQDGNWSFPDGMIWIKHFDFDLDHSHPGTVRKRLETRVLVRNATGAYGVSYRWNEAGTEAFLSPNGGEDFPVSYTDGNGAPANVGWHIPSRSECMSCHTATGGHALSMNTRQFNLDNSISGQSGNLLSLLSNGGYLAGFSGSPAALPRHHRPNETSVDLEERVRSYIAVNCAYCHQPGGGTPDSWDGRAHLTMEQTGILYGHPASEATPDLTDHIVRPGDKANSALWNKINARSVINGSYNGYSQMPPLATNVFDTEGIALIGEWIDHHANVAPAPAAGSITQTDVSENGIVGHLLGTTAADDPDVRENIADQSLLTYTITSGNNQRLFSINPTTGELRLNGIIDYERQSQHQLDIEISDHFAPNPGVLHRSVVVDLINETSPDATADLDGNGISDLWESSFGVTHPSGDDDHDGVPAFFEFLTGSNPNAADTPSLLSLSHQIAGSPVKQEIGWNVRNGFVLGEHYHVQRSTELGGWINLQPADYIVESITPAAPGVSRVVIKVPANNARQFLRLSGP